MAGLIPQRFIDDLLNRTDIVEVVGSRVQLKKTGKNYSACCPFHQEKTPSFSVSPDKQFYYCFGCGAGGNALELPDGPRPPGLPPGGRGSGQARRARRAARGQRAPASDPARAATRRSTRCWRPPPTTTARR